MGDSERNGWEKVCMTVKERVRVLLLVTMMERDVLSLRILVIDMAKVSFLVILIYNARARH